MRLGATTRGTDLRHELVEQYAYTGSYASFERQLRLLRPAVVLEPDIASRPTRVTKLRRIGHTPACGPWMVSAAAAA